MRKYFCDGCQGEITQGADAHFQVKITAPDVMAATARRVDFQHICRKCGWTSVTRAMTDGATEAIGRTGAPGSIDINVTYHRGTGVPSRHDEVRRPT